MLSDDDDSLSDDEAKSLVQRRLLLAGALGAVALPLALVSEGRME